APRPSGCGVLFIYNMSEDFTGRPSLEVLDENTFKELLENKQYRALRERLAASEPTDIADLLASIPSDEAVIAFRLLPKSLAISVFDDMDGAFQNRLLEAFSDQAARNFLEAMPPDDRTELLDEVPAKVARRLLQILSPDQRRVTLQLLGYNEETAGREMTPLFVDLHSDMTVAQALERVRQLAITRETVYECYVMDRRRYLIGTVSLKDLVIADPDARVNDIMKPDPHFVSTHTDREEVARELREHDLLAIPVVDAEQRLVGTITYDDVADIMEREATEDIYRFGAVPGTERGYFASRIFSVVRRRTPWLFLLIAVSLVIAPIIFEQEDLLAEVWILTAFIPLVIATGGNVGAQSATVVIRGLATGEVNPRRAQTVVLREVGIGAIMGVALGTVALGLAYAFGRNLEASIVVGMTLAGISVMATLVGGALPFVFRRLKIDPALVSAPFITTIMDIFGVALYFGIAHMILVT
ncbi:MAG: magnesium transporter, partial [Dehalococcoidia bacterium]|nr:magnesium transporter [Dehalococcoidia bacterium]